MSIRETCVRYGLMEPIGSNGDCFDNALHCKTQALVEAVAGHPFMWVDDEITGIDRMWVSANHPGRALLHRVDAAVGLTAAEFAVLDDWLRKPSVAE